MSVCAVPGCEVLALSGICQPHAREAEGCARLAMYADRLEREAPAREAEAVRVAGERRERLAAARAAAASAPADSADAERVLADLAAECHDGQRHVAANAAGFRLGLLAKRGRASEAHRDRAVRIAADARLRGARRVVERAYDDGLAAP